LALRKPIDVKFDDHCVLIALLGLFLAVAIHFV
jgi:hypothetical protein